MAAATAFVKRKMLMTKLLIFFGLVSTVCQLKVTDTSAGIMLTLW
jgi:hypothetical protein